MSIMVWVCSLQRGKIEFDSVCLFVSGRERERKYAITFHIRCQWKGENEIFLKLKIKFEEEIFL